MNILNIKKGCLRFVETCLLSEIREEEIKIRQGANNWLPLPRVFSQGRLFSKSLSSLAPLLPKGGVQSSLLGYARYGSYIELPLLLFFAIVKDSKYEQIAKKINSHLWRSFQIPSKIDPNFFHACSFLHQQAGTLFFLGFLVSHIASFALGNPLSGVVVVAFALNVLLSSKQIPAKITLPIKQALSCLTAIALFVSEPDLLLWSLMIVELAYKIVQNHRLIKLDFKFFFRKIGVDYPFDDIQADVVSNREPSFTELLEILESSDDEYEINPAASSKRSLSPFEGRYHEDYDDYLRLFSQTNYSFECLVKRTKYEDKILAHFVDLFGVSKQELQEQWLFYIEKAAKEKNLSADKYLRDLCEKNMENFVSDIKRNRELKQALSFLKNLNEEGRKIVCIDEMASAILAYLIEIKGENKQIEFEDMLLTLVLEAGGYCREGIIRALKLMATNLLESKKAGADLYQTRIECKLEEIRENIFASSWEEYICFPVEVRHDIHIFERVKPDLAVGFLPLYKDEIEEINMAVFPFHFEFRASLRREYETRIREPFEEEKDIFFQEFYALINKNPNLSQEDKNLLVEKYFGNSNEVFKKYSRALLVMWGIWRRKSPL